MSESNVDTTQMKSIERNPNIPEMAHGKIIPTVPQIQQQYQKVLNFIPQDIRQTKEQSIMSAFQALSQKMTSQQEKVEFGELQQAIVKLKLARHFQKTNEGAVDVNTLYDAILESPKFIDTDRGSLNHLFETHQAKTLQKIAEARKRRSEIGDKKN